MHRSISRKDAGRPTQAEAGAPGEPGRLIRGGEAGGDPSCEDRAVLPTIELEKSRLRAH